MKRHYLVGYDISDPKRLAKVAKIMSGFGSRIQYSFFHCMLSARQKMRLKDLLEQTIHEDEDQIMIVPVTEKQIDQLEFIGFKTSLSTEGLIIV